MIAWFGVQYAGAIVVPVETGLSVEQIDNIAQASGMKASIVDEEARDSFGGALEGAFDLHVVTARGASEGLELPEPSGDDVASILYTSGTTGSPKGVMLTHANFLAMIASLAKIFPLQEDRLLSVLPLHHTFEFSCGLLLPLSRGARVVYLDEVNGDRLTHGLKVGKITLHGGVPASGSFLERKIRNQVDDRGPVARWALTWAWRSIALWGNRPAWTLVVCSLVRYTSVWEATFAFLSPGVRLFRRALQKLLRVLGTAEGYGLTESSPVLTVAKGHPGAKIGHVGKAVPGVEVKIRSQIRRGSERFWPRSPNVMKGYFQDEEATAQVLDEEGWLRTGDLGRLDHRDRLSIVGRAKDVVVTSSEKTSTSTTPRPSWARSIVFRSTAWLGWMTLGEANASACWSCLLGSGERSGCGVVSMRKSP